MLSLFRSLLVVCLVCPLLSVSAFFALNSPKLVVERLDPLVFPGGVASHLHTILGGSNWSDRYDYNTSFASDCTTMPVSVDKSNYWTPTLYYVYPNQSLFTVVPLGFGRIYYLPRPGPKKQKITAFPKGFRMVAGDMNRRTFNASSKQDNAISFVCLDYYGNHQGDPEWFQRNDFFTKHNCPNGMRLQFNFPACWDGKNLYKDDNSHVAYTIQNVDGGDCPDSHPVHFVNLFFEFIYETNNFPINANGITWALSNGDTTGYGFHGDFQNGWDVDVLQAALDQCDDAGGDPAQCAPFKPYMQKNTESCHPAKQILNEKVGLNGEGIAYLPGCNKLWIGTGPKPTCDASWPGLQYKTAYEPVASVMPAGWQRLGCYAEGTTGHALMGGYIDLGNDATGGKCAAYCQALNFSIAATEYASQCYCGSQMSNGASLSVAAAPSQCNAICKGRYTENCGGNGYMNVMFNPAIRTDTTAASTLPAGYFRDGCVAEPAGGRLFTAASLLGDDMTPAKCAGYCADQKQNGKGSFPYAGSEYGRECYCSATLPASATPRVADGKCNMGCKGAPSLTCGGPGAMSLYSLKSSWKVAALNATALPASWSPVGCFGINAATAMSAMTVAPFFTDVAMTNGMCAARCASFKATYAVTQFGSQCFCGDANSIAAVVKAAGAALAPEKCSTTCGGAVLERCGGLTTSSVMVTSKVGAGAPAKLPSADSGSAAAAPVPADPKVQLRITVRMAAVNITQAWLSTISGLIADGLNKAGFGITPARIYLEIEGGSAAGTSRRLLAAASDSTNLLLTFQPSSDYDTVKIPASQLSANFITQWHSDTDMSKQLSASGFDTSSAPETVQSSDPGSGSAIGAAAAASPASVLAVAAVAVAALLL